MSEWTPEFCEAIRKGLMEQFKGLATSIDRRLEDHHHALDKRLAEFREDVRTDILELKALSIANRQLLTGNGSPEHGLVWKLDAVRSEVRKLWAAFKRRERAKARIRRMVFRSLQSRTLWKVVWALIGGGGLVAAAAAIWEMGSR